ncbi:MAG TPA: Lrp/AsnC ligand binding domain-containing protein [Rhizomicrobium sp.]|nr:Lrp/AsnC ligand binding domain-containing protein [Rhizomicrobium sp.]
MNNLDATDKALLRELQRDGRITNQDLAQCIGLSPAACLERVKRLREKGVIRRYMIDIDPGAVDLALLIFVEVSLHSTVESALDEFKAIVRNTPEILECHLVAGGFDYLIKARVRDMNAYRAFLGERLSLLPGVRETRTYAVLEEVKSTTALPI